MIRSKEIVIFLVFVLLALAFTYPVIFKINTAVYGPVYNTDNRASLWFYWWFKYASIHNLNWQNNIMIAAPFGVKNAMPLLFPFCQVPARLFSILINEIFAYNIMLLLSFILSSITMYFLSFYLTKNRAVAFISGLIYGFCPYHFNKAWEHYGLALIEWMPLYILFLLLLREKRSFKYILVCAAVLAMVALNEPHYGYMMAVFTLGFIIFVLWRQKSKALALIKRTLFMSVISICIIFIAVYPIVLSILSNRHLKSADLLSQEFFSRPMNYLFSQSTRPLSYLLPAASHPIFGKFTKSMFGTLLYGRGPIEQTLYLGWIPLILSFIALRRRKNIGEYIGLFAFSALIAFLFSLPPYLNLGLFKIYFPPYFMYKILPMFRAYARFGILVMLCISILAGFGLKYILERIKSFQKRFIFTAVVTCLILFEFTNIPPFRVTDIDKNIPPVYFWLKTQSNDFAIVEYPLGEAGIGEAYTNLDYLLYQRIHQKKLVNGAMPGTYAFKIRDKILKVTEAKTPGILSWLGAKYVVMHLDIYKSGMDRVAQDIIGEAPNLKKVKGFKFVKAFGEIEVYEIMAKPENPNIDSGG